MSRIRSLSSLVFTLGLASAALAGDELGLWNPDIEAAKKQAKEQGKDLLIEFTGSDWCPPCMRLWKETFSLEEFQKKVSSTHVLVVMDKPKDTSKLTKEQWAISDAMHERFAVNKWPTIFLADAEGRPYARFDDYGALNGSDGWLTAIERMQQNEAKRDEHLAAAAKATGLEKAKHLDAALSVCGEFCPTAPYDAEIDAIAQSDPKNETGAKRRWFGKRAADRLEIELPKLGKAGQWEKLATEIETFLKDAEPEGEVRQKALYWQGVAYSRLNKLEDATRSLEAAKALGADLEFGKRAAELLARGKK